MINYSEFHKTSDHSYNLYHALNYCREQGEDGLIFDKGIYDFYSDRACEDVLCISNHTLFGLSRIAFLLKGMENFTIEGNGSEFVFYGGIVPFAVKKSANITIRNLSIDYDSARYLHSVAVDAGEGYFDMEVLDGATYRVLGQQLMLADSDGNEEPCRWLMIRSFGDDIAYIPEAIDCYGDEPRYELIGENRIRVRDCYFEVSPGMHLWFSVTSRQAANILVADSKDISIDNVCMYRSHGMGVLAEKSENITIDKMVVKAKEGRLFSLNADATHFVNCRGLVKVTNSHFSEQQDDALNVHGIFTKIIDRTDDYILVRYMHECAKGIDIFDAGAKFAVIDAKTVLPKAVYEIEKVEVINLNCTKLYVVGGTRGIQVGDLVEDLKGVCDLVFENNTVVNNRARGILVAAKGNVQIRKNYFSTPGVAILFESDAQGWYESGATNQVTITGNTFENCKFTERSWGTHVIEMTPRPCMVEGAYYHNVITVEKNVFKNNSGPLLYADNVAKMTFKDNQIVDCRKDALTEFVHCGEIICDAQ